MASPKGGRARPLLEDNSCGRWTELVRVVWKRQAFLVRVRGDLLVCDIDGEDAPHRAKRLRGSMVAAGLCPVVWASGTPGHRQLLVCIPRNRERKRWRERSKAMGMDVKTMVRPPLSPHRMGRPVSLVYPDTVEEALEHLGRWEVTDADDRYLTSRTFKLLRYGDENADQSVLTLQIAMGACAKGWSANRTYNALLSEQNLGGLGLRKRIEKGSAQRAAAWFFEYVWPRAEEYVASNPPITDITDARLAIHALRLQADECEWRNVPITYRGEEVGVRGASVYKLVLGACDIALKAGRIDVSISQRQFAEAAGLGSRETVRKALLGAQKLGWLRLLTKGKGRQPSEWRLLVPRHEEGLRDPLEDLPGREVSV